jgi:hypothetical protein
MNLGPEMPLEFGAFVYERIKHNLVLDLPIPLLPHQQINPLPAEMMQRTVIEPTTLFQTGHYRTIRHELPTVQVVQDMGQTVGVKRLGEDILVNLWRIY